MAINCPDATTPILGLEVYDTAAMSPADLTAYNASMGKHIFENFESIDSQVFKHDGTVAMTGNITMPQHSSVLFGGGEGDNYIRSIYDADAESEKLQLVSGITQATGVMLVDGRMGVQTQVYGATRVGDSPLQTTAIDSNSYVLCGASQAVVNATFPSPDNVTVTHKNYASKIALNAFVNAPGTYGTDLMESTLAVVQECTDGEARIIDTFINDYNGIGGDLAQAMGQVFIARNGASALPIYRSRYNGTTYSHIEKINTSNEREYFAKETTNFDGVIQQATSPTGIGAITQTMDGDNANIKVAGIVAGDYLAVYPYKVYIKRTGSFAGVSEHTANGITFNCSVSSAGLHENQLAITNASKNVKIINQSINDPATLALKIANTANTYHTLINNTDITVTNPTVTASAKRILGTDASLGFQVNYGTYYNLDLNANKIKICSGATGNNCSEITPTVGLKTYWTSGGLQGIYDYYGVYVYDDTNQLETYAGEVKTSNLAGTVYSKLTPGIVNIKDANGGTVQTLSESAYSGIKFKSGLAGTYEYGQLRQYGSNQVALEAWAGGNPVATIVLYNNSTGNYHDAANHTFRNAGGTPFATIGTDINCSNGVYKKGGNAINIQATAAPSTAPNHLGQIHNDSTNKQVRIAHGTSTTSDWTALRTGLNGTAEIYQQDNTTATTISTQDAWVDVVNFSAGVCLGFTVANSAATTNAGYGGTYPVSGFVVGIPALANKTYEFALAINDVIQDKTRVPHTYLSTTDIDTIPISGTLQVIPTDVVKLKVRCRDVTTANITIKASNIKWGGV